MMLYKIISEFFAPNSLLTPSRYWRYPITRKGVHSPFLCGGWRRESNSTGRRIGGFFFEECPVIYYIIFSRSSLGG
jgi:hypothetical protein